MLLAALSPETPLNLGEGWGGLMSLKGEYEPAWGQLKLKFGVPCCPVPGNLCELGWGMAVRCGLCHCARESLGGV